MTKEKLIVQIERISQGQVYGIYVTYPGGEMYREDLSADSDLHVSAPDRQTAEAFFRLRHIL